jgi:hypothetical protein
MILLNADASAGVIFALFFIVIRIVAAVFCANRATKLNRSSGGWAFFGLVFPIIAMIWINCLKPKIEWHENTPN